MQKILLNGIAVLTFAMAPLAMAAENRSEQAGEMAPVEETMPQADTGTSVQNEGGQDGPSGYYSYRESDDTTGDHTSVAEYLDLDLVTTDNKTLGHIEDLLIDPDSNEVTHAVVALQTQGKYVTMPIEDLLPSSDEDALITAMSIAEMSELVAYAPAGEVWAPVDELEGGLGTASGPSDEATQQVMDEAGQPLTEMAAAGILGRTILTADGQRVGEVDDLLMDDQKAVTHVILEVGGFLGIGSKPVSVQLQHLSMAEDDSLYIDMTKEELESLPEYVAKDQPTEN